MSTLHAFEVLELLDPEAGESESTSPAPEALLRRILLDDIGQTSDSEGRPASRHGRPSRERWRRGLLAVAASVVVVAGAIAVVSVARPGPNPHTRGATSPRVIHWRLAATLIGPQYEVATGKPNAVVGVVCGDTGGTCLLSTGYGLDYGGGGGMFVSGDGGHTWQPSPLPQGIAVTSLASCPTKNWCAAGGGLLDPATGDPAAGKPMRDPELLVSTDSGRSWTVRSVPLPVNVQQLPAYGSLPAETTYWPGGVDDVICSAPEICNVLGQAQTSGPGGSGLGDELLFLHTSDGGLHWSTQVLPPLPGASSYQLVEYPGEGETMSCPSATSCTVIASPYNPGEVVSWGTHDGGQSWQVSEVMAGSQVSPSLSCPTEQVCWLGPVQGAAPGGHLLRSNDGGLSWSPVALPTFLPTSTAPGGAMTDDVSCTSADSCVVSLGDAGMGATSDGGATWQHVTIPGSVGAVLQVSCGDSGGCLAIADPAVGGLPSMDNGGSMILTNEPPTGAAN